MVAIKEKCTFNTFDSSLLGLYLVDRELESPKEKAFTIDIPYTMSEEDFSMITGERFFENRSLKYKFMCYETQYNKRKKLQDKCRKLLMTNDFSKLVDTHNPNYYWWGKCAKVDCSDTTKTGKFEVTIEFMVYPFLIADSSFYEHDWNPFSFSDGVAQFYKYRIKWNRKFQMVHVGDRAGFLKIISSDNMSLKLNGISHSITKGEHEYRDIRMVPGINSIEIEGNGTIALYPRTEVMV